MAIELIAEDGGPGPRQAAAVAAPQAEGRRKGPRGGHELARRGGLARIGQDPAQDRPQSR